MAQTVTFILITLINIILWIFFIVYFKKMFSPNNLLKDVRREVEKLLIEIDRTADQDITILEARIKALRELIDLADTKIMLSKNADKSKLREQKIFTDIEKATSSEESVKVDIDFENYKIPMHMQNEYARKSKNGQQEMFPVVETEVIEKPTITAAPSSLVRPLKAKVLEYHRAGQTPDIISQKVNLSVREIELIIEMYGQ